MIDREKRRTEQFKRIAQEDKNTIEKLRRRLRQAELAAEQGGLALEQTFRELKLLQGGSGAHATITNATAITPRRIVQNRLAGEKPDSRREQRYFLDAKPAQPLTPLRGHWNMSRVSEFSKIVAVCFFGAEEVNLTEVILAIAVTHPSVRPIFFLQSENNQDFGTYGHTFEYLPAFYDPRNTKASARWRRYITEKYSYLLVKWGVEEIWHFGASDTPIFDL